MRHHGKGLIRRYNRLIPPSLENKKFAPNQLVSRPELLINNLAKGFLTFCSKRRKNNEKS